MKLPLLQPSVAAIIGCMRPPASLLFLLISGTRLHSPVTSLAVQEAQGPSSRLSPSAQMKPK
jgi:hypothetical protein